MIDYKTQNGYYSSVVLFFHQMELSGITEDNYTYSDQKDNDESLCKY